MKKYLEVESKLYLEERGEGTRGTKTWSKGKKLIAFIRLETILRKNWLWMKSKSEFILAK